MLFWSVICRFKFIGEFDVFPLMCAADKVWITQLTLIQNIIRSVRSLHAHVYRSIWRRPHYDVTDKNNNVSSEGLDRYYHKYSARSIGLAKTLAIMFVSTFKIAVILYLLLHVFQIDWLIVGFITSNSLYLLSKHNLAYHQYAHPCGFYIIWCL